MQQTDKSYYLERTRPEALPQLLLLMKSNPGSSEVAHEDYLQWQYNENPAGSPIMYTAHEEQSKDYIGQYLVIPAEYIIDGAETRGTLSLNTLTREDFRGRGLFTQMANKTYADCATEDLAFTIGFPNPNSYPGFINKLGFKSPGEVPLYLLPLRPITLVWNRLFPSGVKHGQELFLGNNAVIMPDNTDETISLFNPETDADLYNAFWEEYKNTYSALTSRTIDYLKWRYCYIPRRNYVLLKCVVAGKMQGYIVLRAKSIFGIKNGLIIDFCVLNNKEAAKTSSALLRAAMGLFRAHKIALVGCLMQDHANEAKCLKKHWFFKAPKKLVPQPIPFIVRVNKDFIGAATIQQFNNWFLTFGDYDVM
jgi:hypothetical protein